jgi:hypothetical protein
MTKEIRLKGGDATLVDEEDYPLLSRYEWQRAGTAGYAVTTMQTLTGKNHTIYMHKLIMAGFWLCDHINQNPLDNRKANLRRATMQENGWNKGKPKACRHGKPTSQYKGVSFVPLRGKPRWVAMIKHVKPGAHKTTGKVIRIGYFDSEEAAARAYNAKVRELRGEWAWVNPLPEVG